MYMYYALVTETILKPSKRCQFDWCESYHRGPAQHVQARPALASNVYFVSLLINMSG